MGDFEIHLQEVNLCGHNFFVAIIPTMSCRCDKLIVHMIGYTKQTQSGYG